MVPQATKVCAQLNFRSPSIWHQGQGQRQHAVVSLE